MKMRIMPLVAALAAIAAIPTTASGAAHAQAIPDGTIRVTLLGTGTPHPTAKRFGPSILVQASGKTLLFDCGRGVTQQLFKAKVAFGKIDRVFLTHLHSDHVVGIPDLWLTGWLAAPFAKRTGPFRITGPAGTAVRSR